MLMSDNNNIPASLKYYSSIANTNTSNVSLNTNTFTPGRNGCNPIYSQSLPLNSQQIPYALPNLLISTTQSQTQHTHHSITDDNVVNNIQNPSISHYPDGSTFLPNQFTNIVQQQRPQQLQQQRPQQLQQQRPQQLQQQRPQQLQQPAGLQYFDDPYLFHENNTTNLYNNKDEMLSTNYYNPINHHNLINDNQNTNTNHNISIGNSTSSHIINNTCKKRNNNTYNRINKKRKDFTKKKIITSNTNTNSTTTANNVYPVDASANQGSNNTNNKIFRKMACTSCKRRKIKCDGAKPVCGSCSKRKLAQEYCIYDSSPWISGAVREKKMLDQIAELRREKNELLNKIRLLEKNDDTTVDNPANTSSPVQQISPYFVDEFYTLFKENSGDGSDSCVYYGPFSWQTLVKFDDSFNFVSDKIIKKIREDCYVDLKSTHDNSRSLRYTNLYSNEASIMTDNIRQDVLPKGVDYPLYRSLNSMDHKVELLQVYLEFLPNILELKILIDNYFEGFASYAFFCVLDKEDLYADFEDIFGIDLNTITSVSHHPPLKLDCKMINKNIANVFSRFARLILTSALSFFLGLGNFINMSEAKNINGIREIKLLERFPYVNDPKQIYDIFTKYDISYVEDLTELCLNLDGFLGTPSIPILHTLCMFFIYTLLNTRHLMDFELYTMHSLFTLATRMAIKLGLHSDIDVLYKDYPLKFRKQLKKTWIFLLFHDYYQNIRTGTPLNIVWKQELYYHTLLKRAREDLSTCYCVVLFFQQFLSRFSNADAAECIHLITEMSHLCRDHFKLDLSDIFELISSGTLHEKELYANIRLIRTYLYVYALASSVFQNMYVSTNSQPLLKEKYRLWALKYSTIYLMSVLDILKTLKQFHVKYNLDKNCIFYLLRHIRDLAIKPILFLSGLIIEYLKEYRLKSNDLAYKTKQTKMFRIDDLIEGQTVLNTSLRELEIPFDENNTDELHKLGKIFAKNNTMTLLRFLYMVLEELNDFLSDIKIYDIRYIFLYLNILITYVVENFKDLKFDVSFVNKDFLMTFNSNKKQSDIRKNKKEFEKRDFSSNNNSGAGSSKIDLKGKIPSFKSKNGLKQVHNIESNALREENIYRIETNKHDNSIKTTSNANSFIDSNVINNNNNNNINININTDNTNSTASVAHIMKNNDDNSVTTNEVNNDYLSEQYVGPPKHTDNMPFSNLKHLKSDLKNNWFEDLKKALDIDGDSDFIQGLSAFFDSSFSYNHNSDSNDGGINNINSNYNFNFQD